MNARLDRYRSLASVPMVSVGAVGTGMLVSADQAHADVKVFEVGRHLSFTTSTNYAPNNWFFSEEKFSTESGATAFRIFRSEFNFTSQSEEGTEVKFFAHDGVFSASDRGYSFWARLNSGDMISSGVGANLWSGNYASLFNSQLWYGTYTYGPWGNFDQEDRSSGFIGFGFYDANDEHRFGWVELDLNDDGRVYVERWAYDTTGAGILAGQTSAPVVPGAPTAVGLVALAAGAAGVRRKRAS